MSPKFPIIIIIVVLIDKVPLSYVHLKPFMLTDSSVTSTITHLTDIRYD